MHFEYFSAMADPYAGVTAEVDVTRFLEACRGAGRPFFLSFLYCAGRTANAVPQLRQRIAEGRPVEFARCDTSHTVLREDGTYSYCRLDCMQPFEAYLPPVLQTAGRENQRLKLNTLPNPADNTDGTIQKMPRVPRQNAGGIP